MGISPRQLNREATTREVSLGIAFQPMEMQGVAKAQFANYPRALVYEGRKRGAVRVIFEPLRRRWRLKRRGGRQGPRKLERLLYALLTTPAQFSLVNDLKDGALTRRDAMTLKHLFTEHPSSLGETYREHMRASLSYAVPLLGAALAAFVHAVFPFLHTTTASTAVKRLYDRMNRRCVTCPSVRAHRPDLFVSAPSKAVFDPGLMYEI